MSRRRDWRTRTRGTRRQVGQHFPVGDRSKGDIVVGKTLQRPMTVWERVDREEKRRQEGYRKRIEEHRAKMRRLREIKLLVDRCNDSDPVRRAMAKAEFEKKYPNEYRHYFETGKIVTSEKEHRTIPIILSRPKFKPKREEKPKEESKPKKSFSADEIEEAVEEVEHEAMVDAKKKTENEVELQEQFS